MTTIQKIDQKTLASLYRDCRQGLKEVYEILTEVDLQTASREELEEVLEKAIDSIEQTKEMLEE